MINPVVIQNSAGEWWDWS